MMLHHVPIVWQKLVTRQNSLGFMHAIAYQTPQLKHLTGYNLHYYWYNGTTYDTLYAKHEIAELGKAIADKVVTNPDYALQTAQNGLYCCRQLIRQAQKFSQPNIKVYSRSQIHDLFLPLYHAYQELIAYLLPPHVIEGQVVKEVENFLASKINDPQKREEAFTLLAQPSRDDHDQIKAALHLAQYIKNNGWTKSAHTKLRHYANSYRWLPMWGLTNQPLEISFFETEIRNILHNFPKPLTEWRRIQTEAKRRKQAAAKLLDTYTASKQTRALVNMMQSYVFLRTFRKNAYCQAHYAMLPLITRLSQLSGLTDIELMHCTYPEILSFLKSGTMPDANLLGRRLQAWAVLLYNDQVYVFSGKKQVAEAIKKYAITQPNQTAKTITGRVACQGQVKGTVKIVLDIQDLGKVHQGDILVAHMTTPDYMPAIYKAGAIVTDEGGVTCHAAIVSREFNVPCIVGTQNATAMLMDGDLVKVDAINGQVTLLSN